MGALSSESSQAGDRFTAVLAEPLAVDDRIVLAGEHASYVGCWMEGALLSSLDAITRLHKRALEA